MHSLQVKKKSAQEKHREKTESMKWTSDLQVSQFKTRESCRLAGCSFSLSLFLANTQLWDNVGASAGTSNWRFLSASTRGYQIHIMWKHGHQWPATHVKSNLPGLTMDAQLALCGHWTQDIGKSILHISVKHEWIAGNLPVQGQYLGDEYQSNSLCYTYIYRIYISLILASETFSTKLNRNKNTFRPIIIKNSTTL